jgi:tetratricopeptide (TPR) repeat protein
MKRAAPRNNNRLLPLLVLILVVVAAAGTIYRREPIREWWYARKSLEQLQQASQSPQADPLILLVYGEKLTASGRHREALDAYRAAAAALPSGATGSLAARIYARFGHALAREGLDAEAVPVLNRAQALDDENPLVYLGYGMVFAQRQMYQFAETQFQLAANLAPDTPEPWYRLGKCHNDNVKPQQAIEPLKRALALAPNSAAIYAELGHAHAYQAEFEPAVQYFRKAVELEPENAHYERSLATAIGMKARKQDEYQEAARLLAKCLEKDPNDNYVVFALGQLHLRFNAVVEAQQYLQRAVLLRPQSAEAWYNLARVEQRLGNEKAAEKANAEFRRLSELHDNAVIAEKKVASDIKNPQLRVELARRYRESGNMIGAYWQFMTALKLKPDMPGVRKEFEEVTKAYQEIISRQVRISARPNDENTMGPPPPAELMNEYGQMVTPRSR